VSPYNAMVMTPFRGALYESDNYICVRMIVDPVLSLNISV